MIPLSLKIEIIIFSFIMFMFLFYLIRKGRISVKHSLIWFIAILVILIPAIFPKFTIWIASLLGIQTISNMIMAILIVLLIVICISLTVIVSGQKEKITLLIQEVSILKGEKNDKK